MNELSTALRQAAGKRVLLVGDLILDRYVYGDAERVSPEAPVPVLRIVERRDGVGGAGSVAACLHALGVSVEVVGLVGDDAMGERLRQLLREAGATDRCLLTCPGRPTTTKTRLVGLAQHRHRQQLLRVDEEETGELSAADRSRLVNIVLAAIDEVDAICIEDYEKGVVTAPLVSAVVEAARKRGVPVLVDPGRLGDYGRYRGATLLTPNRNELAIAVGRASVEHEAIARDAETVRAQVEAEALAVTLDREGALLVEAGGAWEHVPTRPRSVYDNTGAGDAVLAMLAAALVGGASRLDAVRLANVAGGLEVEKFGCVPITADEVHAELRLSDRDRNGKLRGAADLVSELNLRRDRGETVAFTNGCYDILHAGHVDFLARCRDEASLLVVGLNTDASVRRQEKCVDRPLNGEHDRAAVLAALACVDYVVLFDDDTPANLIEQLRPDVLLKGADWAKRGVVGQPFVESYGGRVKLLPLLEGHSTTALIERIRGAVQAGHS